MQRLGLIDDILQRRSVGDEFIVDDGFLLIGRIVGSKVSFPAETQVSGASDRLLTSRFAKCGGES